MAHSVSSQPGCPLVLGDKQDDNVTGCVHLWALGPARGRREQEQDFHSSSDAQAMFPLFCSGNVRN